MKIYLTQFRKNIISGVFAYGLNAIIMLISYPIYLKYLGFELLGLWATFSIIITLAEVGNLGISETLMKFLAQYNYTNNIPKLKEYLNTGGFIVLLSGVIFFMVIIPLRVPIINLLNIPGNYSNLAHTLLIFIVLISFTQIFLSYLRGILAGIQHLDIANAILVCTNLVRVVIMITLLIFNSTLWSVVIAYIIANFFSIIVYLILIRKYLGFKFLDIKSVNKAIFKELIFFGGNITGNKIFTIFFVPLTKGFIARYIGLTEVGYFEISWKIIYQLRNLIQKGFLAFLPKISELHGQSKNQEVFSLVRRGFFYSVFMGIIFLLGIYFFGDFILKLWLGENTNIIILQGLKILTVSSSFSLLFVPHYYALLGMGRPGVVLFEGIIKTTINVIILMILVTMSFFDLKFVFYSVMMSIVFSNVYIIARYVVIKNQFNVYVTKTEK